MFVLFIFAACCLSVTMAGSPCPPRANLYPCVCFSVPQTKKQPLTIVACHRLPDSTELDSVFDTLRSMQIDHFYIYDSFWQAKKLGASRDNKRVLPTDWFTLLKIENLEIVDTPLAPCFACDWKIGCRNSITKKFTAMNSSSSDKICTLCDTGRQNKQPWTGCLSKLTHFQFSHGSLTQLGVDLFPVPMPELQVVNVTHNKIVKVDSKAFLNTPNLVSLDLSHNVIEYLDHLFIGYSMKLEFLDVSWNMIKTIGTSLFSGAPHLKIFKANNNVIVNLKEAEWKNVPSSLRNIDLSDNPIHCDCNIRWVNSTFHVSANLLARCATPSEYSMSKLRSASRYMSERCDESGNLGDRKKSKRRSSSRGSSRATKPQ